MSKYRAIRTNGFASKREAKRAQELKILEGLGIISNLRYQVSYELIPKQDGERACRYVADFVYIEAGQERVEDSKGFRTDAYIIKRKLMKFRHGITLLET